MKIAIIGAGIGGLACAYEFERHGIICDIYERDESVGWIWPSVTFWPRVLTNGVGDILEYLSNEYDISIDYIAKARRIVMKSASKEIVIKGKNLGYFLKRGKYENSLEQQLERKLSYSTIHYNNDADYTELSKEYDFVIVASGMGDEARDLGIWEDLGKCYVYGGVAIGSFNFESSTIYFNTEYAGTGFARLTPFNAREAILGIYVMGLGDVEYKLVSLFNKFIEMENLSHLKFLSHIKPPVTYTGRVKNAKVGNILLIGSAAGLTDRLIGVGAYNAIISGILAARSLIQNKDYDELIKPLKQDVENISAFRDVVDKFSNEDFDRLLTLLGLPAVKQLIYNTGINFADMAGSILKHLNS